MTGAVMIVGGTFLASIAISYAWWCKVRIINLRQCIFDERDRLFDYAMNLGAFDDPAYRVARDHINAIAACADLVSIQVFAYVMARGIRRKTLLEKTNNEQLRIEIDASLERCALILSRYLLYQTLTGLALMAVVQVNRLQSLAEQHAKHWAHRWVHSLMPSELGHGSGDGNCC